MYEKLSPVFRESMLKLTEDAIEGRIVPKRASASTGQHAEQSRTAIDVNDRDWAASLVKRAILEKLASTEPREFGKKTAEVLQELRNAIDSVESGTPEQAPVRIMSKGFGQN